MEGYLTEEGRNSPFPLPFVMFGRVPFFPLPRILPFCNVLLRISFAALPKLNINFTGCAIDNFVAACYNGITRKGKEGKHDVCKDELEGSKGKIR